ncbi:MAG: ThuA domain-containing protein, partial [Dysgonamonadaceae bacterium]|nr:ThuA domain-containing protein [Dysgonamonadaceae bacterium]
MKTTLLSLMVLFLLSGSVCTAQKYDNKTTGLKGKRILLFTKNGKGYIHENIPASIDMFFKLSKKEG